MRTRSLAVARLAGLLAGLVVAGCGAGGFGMPAGPLEGPGTGVSGVGAPLPAVARAEPHGPVNAAARAANAVATAAHGDEVLGARPAALLTLRVSALKRDPVYGPAMHKLLRLALERVHVVQGYALEALESADECVVAIDENKGLPPRILLKGVRADLDPSRLVGAGGEALWLPRARGPAFDELSAASGDATLFALPTRDWVIVSGAAEVEHARSVLTGPHMASAMPDPGDDDAVPGVEDLASLRIDGPTLTSLSPGLRRGSLMAVGANLRSLRVALARGREGAVLATLRYDDDASAAASRASLQSVVDALIARVRRVAASVAAGQSGKSDQAAKAKENGDGEGQTKAKAAAPLDWLAPTVLEVQGRDVRGRTPLPPRLLSDLAGADVPL